MRFILAVDLTDARGEFGGLKGQLNHSANVSELSIADHAVIAVHPEPSTRNQEDNDFPVIATHR